MAQAIPNNTLLVSTPKSCDKKPDLSQVEDQSLGCENAGIADKAPSTEGGSEVERAKAYADREPTYIIQALLCMVSMIEGADTQLLGASMKALQEDLGLQLLDISYMTMSQLVCTNLAAPFWGIMADRGILKRKTILMIGACGQGTATILLGCSASGLAPMVLCRGMTGCLLAALRPISNGIIADVTGENKRGKIFGRVQSSLLFGMFITTITVVPIANDTILGLQGWRVAFVLVGCIALTVCVLTGFLMTEPERTEENEDSENTEKGCRAVVAEVQSLARFFKIPTFCVMIMQGIFGTIPWSVMGYMTLFFLLTGIEPAQVAVLSGVGPVAGAFGNIIGGLVADKLAARFGLHGRPLSAQITVACGIPLIYLVFWGVPPGSGTFWIYFFLNVAFGLLGSWAQSGTNFPILAHIVPASARSRVMAWECALENSIANAVGPLVVSLLAEKAFGYEFGSHGDVNGVDLASARALGQAMAATICVPWALCFVAYSLLHYTYPRDICRMEREAELEGIDHAGTANTSA